jgi:hypothetical protein
VIFVPFEYLLAGTMVGTFFLSIEKRERERERERADESLR